jgi:hypothetical protein
MGKARKGVFRIIRRQRKTGKRNQQQRNQELRLTERGTLSQAKEANTQYASQRREENDANRTHH